MPRVPKKTKVVHKKLGREQAFGQATIEHNKIEIDERLTTYRYLLILTHEKLHILFPDWSETKVRQVASQLSKFYWHNNFRWVDLPKRK